MKFRIRKKDELYYAEYKSWGRWWFVSDSFSKNIEDTRKACEEYKNRLAENNKDIEVFEL